MRLRGIEVEKIHQLWDELALFPSARTDEALDHLIKTLCAWTGADNARWHATVRLLRGKQVQEDGMCGWRLRTTRALLPRSPQQVKLSTGFNRVQKDFEVGMNVKALSLQAGRKFQVHRMRDGFIDFSAFRKTDYYKTYYQDAGISDRMWICFPMSADSESIIVFDRHGQSKNFTARQAALAGEAWRGLRWFHQKLLLSHGLVVAQSPLSPGCRRVLQELLSGKSEKEIAATLGQTPATTHQYVKAVLRHFSVSSRSSLMALWLGSR